MTSSTYASSVIVLVIRTPAIVSRCWRPMPPNMMWRLQIRTRFDAGRPGQVYDLGEIDAVVAALAQAIRTRTNIWLPFLVDLLPEQHVRRLSLVLQRHGLNLLIGRELWPCPIDGGINEVDIALRAKSMPLMSSIERRWPQPVCRHSPMRSRLNCRRPGLSAPHTQQWSDFLQQLEVQYGTPPGAPGDKRGLAGSQAWSRALCGLARASLRNDPGEAAQFLNAFGHRTQTGRNWQRPTVSALVNGRYNRRPTAA